MKKDITITAAEIAELRKEISFNPQDVAYIDNRGPNVFVETAVGNTYFMPKKTALAADLDKIQEFAPRRTFKNNVKIFRRKKENPTFGL